MRPCRGGGDKLTPKREVTNRRGGKFLGYNTDLAFRAATGGFGPKRKDKTEQRILRTKLAVPLFSPHLGVPTLRFGPKQDRSGPKRKDEVEQRTLRPAPQRVGSLGFLFFVERPGSPYKIPGLVAGLVRNRPG